MGVQTPYFTYLILKLIPSFSSPAPDRRFILLLVSTFNTFVRFISKDMPSAIFPVAMFLNQILMMR